MKTFAIFYHMSTGYVEGSCSPRFEDSHKKPIEACGDRAYLRIDARLSLGKAQDIAREWAEKHKFVGYKIVRGERLQDTMTVIDYRSV